MKLLVPWKQALCCTDVILMYQYSEQRLICSDWTGLCRAHISMIFWSDLNDLTVIIMWEVEDANYVDLYLIRHIHHWKKYMNKPHKTRVIKTQYTCKLRLKNYFGKFIAFFDQIVDLDKSISDNSNYMFLFFFKVPLKSQIPKMQTFSLSVIQIPNNLNNICCIVGLWIIEALLYLRLRFILLSTNYYFPFIFLVKAGEK